MLKRRCRGGDEGGLAETRRQRHPAVGIVGAVLEQIHDIVHELGRQVLAQGGEGAGITAQNNARQNVIQIRHLRLPAPLRTRPYQPPARDIPS